MKNKNLIFVFGTLLVLIAGLFLVSALPSGCVRDGDNMICALNSSYLTDLTVSYEGTPHKTDTLSIYRSYNGEWDYAVLKINKENLPAISGKVIFSLFYNSSSMVGDSYMPGNPNKTILGLYRIASDWNENNVASATIGSQITTAVIDYHQAAQYQATCTVNPTTGLGEKVQFDITDLYNSWNFGNNFGFAIKDLYGDFAGPDCRYALGGNYFASSRSSSSVVPVLVFPDFFLPVPGPEDNRSAPIILGNINVTTTNSSATISFDTNKLSNLTLNYGNTTSLGTKISNITFSIEHLVLISNLVFNKTYFYNLTLCNNVSNCTTFGTFNFTTLAGSNIITPPVTPDTTAPGTITNFNYFVTINSISMTWTNPTDSDFNGTIIFLNGSQVAILNNFTNSYTLNGLTSNTVYNMTITTVDLSSNRNSSSFSIKTSSTSSPTNPTHHSGGSINQQDNTPLVQESKIVRVGGTQVISAVAPAEVKSSTHSSFSGWFVIILALLILLLLLIILVLLYARR